MIAVSRCLGAYTQGRRWRMLVLLCFCAMLLPTGLVRAQAPAPITLEVVVGFEGSYRVNEWFPVRVTVANDGPDLNGTLEFRFTANASQRFAQEIDLPRGSRKQVTLSVIDTDFSRNGEVVVVSNGTDVIRQPVRVEALSTDQALIGVISSDPTLLNSLNGLSSSGFTAAVVRHIALADIPEQSQALSGMNMLFIHDADSSVLNEAQRGAIETWVQLGGNLIVSGGSNAVQAASGLSGILPVDVGSGLQQQSLESLEQIDGNSSGLPAETTVSEVTPRPGAVASNAQPGTAPLIYRRDMGAGTVTFSTFDLAAVRGWRGETQLWEQVIVPRPTMSLGAEARDQRANLLGEVLRLQVLSLLPVSALFGLLTLYILAIGPINYVVLRRMGRLEWAWVTIPLVVFGFVAGIYLTGRVLRGNETRLAQVTIVQSTEGEATGSYTSYNGLFSPDRTRYTLSFAPNTLVQELQSFDEFSSGGGQIVTSAAAAELRDTLVDIGALRTVMSESTGETGLSVESTLRTAGAAVTGELRYDGSFALEDAVVVRGRAYQPLGTIAPGSTAPINLDTTGSDFPWSLNLEERASVDRQQLLGRIADFNELDQTATTAQGTYLVGWRNEPTISLRVNGREAVPQGVTLYIIRLDNA